MGRVRRPRGSRWVCLQIGIGLVPSIIGMATAAICQQIEAPCCRYLVVASVLTRFAVGEPLPVNLCPRPQSTPCPVVVPSSPPPLRAIAQPQCMAQQQDAGARGRHECLLRGHGPHGEATSTTYVHAIHGWLKLRLTLVNSAAEASPVTAELAAFVDRWGKVLDRVYCMDVLNSSSRSRASRAQPTRSTCSRATSCGWRGA